MKVGSGKSKAEVNQPGNSTNSVLLTSAFRLPTSHFSYDWRRHPQHQPEEARLRAGGADDRFYTDPTLCIGCKACEVACKEWNNVPDDGYRWSGNSYDNTDALGASTWRHVLFIEQDQPRGEQLAGPMSGDRLSDLTEHEDPFRWLFHSDVCKHCEVAGCLEACPTGAIVRTEVGSVLVQNDVCNGCGYCVVWCPSA